MGYIDAGSSGAPARLSRVPIATDDRIGELAPARGANGSIVVRVAAVALASAALASALGGRSAFWLCLPGVLFAAAQARSAAAALAAGIAVAATNEIALGWARLGSSPSALPAVVVPVASIGVLILIRHRLERERDELRGVALSDGLTGVANRRLLLARADYEIARHTRDEHSFAIVMLDLDGFKRLNDRFGHGAGDEILCDVAGALTDALRAQDTVARLGGDEFCVLAPETDRAHAVALATRVKKAVAGATAGVDQLGASLGVAVFPADGETVGALIDAADQRLLEAKRTLYGRARRRAA
jgi:diguanylate cyclase (GGDEF)-like protein